MDPAAATDAIDVGSLQAIFQNTTGRVQQPVVQCVQIKPMSQSNGEATERYRVIFSDTKNYVQTMLATSINDEIHSDRLKKGVIAKLLMYQANSVKGKRYDRTGVFMKRLTFPRILIVTGIQVLQQYGVQQTLGHPEVMDIKDEGATSTISTNGFYGNQPPQQQQQQQTRSMPSHSKPPSSSAHANIYPIEALSPYSHKWTIKARCTHKSDIKTWHNRNGEGKLFSVNLLDESGEIRATGFNDQCDQLYDVFQEGNVYYISSCRVQMAKKQFSNVNNDYELAFERESVVEKAEVQDDVPQVQFNFTPIADLQSVDQGTTIDVIGILKDVAEVSQITSKTTSKPYDKRELTLVDDTEYSVRLTVWGKVASSFEVAPDEVVAFKGVKVSDFGGRSLSLLSSGSMTVNPDIAHSHKLRGWYDHKGQNQTFSTHANVQGTVVPGERKADQTKTAAAVKDEQLGMNDQPDFFNMRATVQHIRQDNFCYAACLSENCNKKVLETEPGQWRCERCEKTHEKPEYRYVMSANVSDHTGQLWVSCFDKVGRVIMGMSADELMEIKEVDDTKFSEVFENANFRTWNLKCLAKMDTYQDNQR